MKIKLDENLPVGLVMILLRLGHDVDSAIDEGLAGQNDSAIQITTEAVENWSGSFVVVTETKIRIKKTKRN